MRTKTKHVELKDNWYYTEGTIPTREELESGEWIPTYFYIQIRGEITEMDDDFVRSTTRENGIVTTRRYKREPKRDRMFFRGNTWYFCPWAESRVDSSVFDVIDYKLLLLYNEQGEYEKVPQKGLQQFDITFTYRSKTDQNQSKRERKTTFVED